MEYSSLRVVVSDSSRSEKKRARERNFRRFKEYWFTLSLSRLSLSLSVVSFSLSLSFLALKRALNEQQSDAR